MTPLMSKMMIPQYRDVLPRHRLSSLFPTIFQKKVTIVTAGPGYGKTVLVAHELNRIRCDNIWYRLDAADKDLMVFFSYIVTGIRKYYPAFWNEDVKKEMSGDTQGSGIKFILSRFMAELEKIVTRNLYIVLDDYHTIQKSQEVKLFLQALMDWNTPLISFVIISRRMPNLKLSRLMADRQATWITEKDLAFSANEIKDLYVHLFNLPLQEKQINSLRQKTGGWVSGLILFYHSLREKSDLEIARSVEHLKGSHRNIFNYLEENVYQLLSCETKEFMIKTSILSRLHIQFCNRFLGIENSRAILCNLEDSHSFTFSVDEDRMSFYYHHLLQEFLQAKLKMEVTPKETIELYNEAALLHEQNDEGLEALKHHILAGNIEDASRLLNHFARPIIKQGRPQMVKSLLSSIPKHFMDEEPWFQYLQAGYMVLCNQLRLAVKTYEKVLKSFRKKKDHEGECICRMELAEYYMSTGDLKRSELEYRKILNKNKLNAYMTIVVIGYLIRVLALLRNTGEADKYARRAIVLFAELNDEVSLDMSQGWIYLAQGFRYAFSGDYHKAMELGETSKILFKSVHQFRFMFSSYFLISSSCFYLGLFSKGMESAMEGVQIDQEKGVFDEYSEFLHLLYARNCLEIEKISPEHIAKAINDCKESLKAFQVNDLPGGVATAFLVLHKAYLRADDISGAELCLRNGLERLQGHDMPLIENELKLALSELLFFDQDRDQNKEAMVLLKEAEQALLYSSWHMCWISRIYARYYWEYGNKERTFNYMVYGLQIAEEEGLDAWIISDRQWIIPLLVELFSMNSMSDYIKKLLIKLNVNAEKQLMTLQSHKRQTIQKAVKNIMAFMPQKPIPSITVNFFGQFKVIVGDDKIPESRWKSQKARSLLKYFLCMRHKGYIDKEILMELLWPDEDPKKSVQRFHVALAALRKALEPNISKGVKSSYIKRSGPSYRVDIEENGVIDIEEFQTVFEMAEQIKQPQKAIRYYKKAESLYRGDFLEEDPYEDWFENEREKYKQMYLLVLKKIIDYCEMKKDYTGCIIFANKYLNMDKYAETIIRSLMKYYALSGNNPMVIRIYEKFKTFIKKELDCSLSNKTEALFIQLVRRNNFYSSSNRAGPVKKEISGLLQSGP